VSRVSAVSALLPGLLLAGVLVSGFSDRAFALYGDTDGALGIDGSVRTVGVLVDNYDAPLIFGEDNDWDGISQSVLRLVVAGRPSERISYEFHPLTVVSFSTGNEAPGSSPFSIVAETTRFRALDLTTEPVDETDMTLSLSIDRAAVKVAFAAADLTLGRQAITFGKAYFWNPLDVFFAFDPRQFDREFKPGVDAARLDVALGFFSGLTLVGAAGSTIDAAEAARRGDTFDATWFGSAVLMRAYTNLEGWDVVAQGGKVYGGYQIGAGAVGEVGPLELRLEGTYLFADEDDSPSLPEPLRGSLVESHATVVAGIGHRFPSSLTLELEYLFNGSGDPDNLDAALVRFATGDSFHLSRHITGSFVSYEILPILVGQIVWLQSFDDGSGQVQPSFVYSIADEAECIGGATLSYGDRPSTAFGLAKLETEFGTFPAFYFLEIKFYF
jgi:hypothetical protein